MTFRIFQDLLLIINGHPLESLSAVYLKEPTVGEGKVLMESFHLCCSEHLIMVSISSASCHRELSRCSGGKEVDT